MATQTTNLTAVQQSVQARFDGRLLTGRVWYAHALYTTLGTETTGDTINLVTLPIGAVVIPELSRILTEAVGGTSVAISQIGDSTTVARYTSTSTSLATLASLAITPVPANSVAFFAVDSATSTVTATMTHSGAPTAGKKVYFRIAYLAP